MTGPLPAEAAPAPRASHGRWRTAAVLTLIALGCGIALGGLSAWFLASVAFAGLTAAALTYNFHVPAAFVRLFALGRTAARYGERLAGHDAALRDQVERRAALFGAMAANPAVRRAGWQLGDEARLADYIDDVEDVDYARLRADLPAATLLAGLAICGGATIAVAPLAVIPIAAMLIATFVVGGRTARTDAVAWEHIRALRRDGARMLGVAMASVVPLQAEGAWQAQCAASLDRLALADQQILPVRRAHALLDALSTLTAPLAAVSVLAAAWMAGQRAEALLPAVFVAFAWLALAEPLQGVSRILFAHTRRRAAAVNLAKWSGATDGNAAVRREPPTRTISLTMANLRRRAPDGRVLGEPLALDLRAGTPTILAGPSGCGKTSLLKQIAGWVGDDTMLCGSAPIGARERADMTFLCLHDAVVLADTVRANLFAPTASETELWRALEAVEMRERIAQAGGLDGWVTQDVLSLGEAQRLNLARAWLSDKPVVLLDEPTEHLDAAQGARLLDRLLERLAGRIVVVSSHAALDRPDLAVIRL